MREMNYSNAAASRRYKAMICAERFPQVIGMLRRHQLSLSTPAQAESLLGEVNDPQELLEAFSSLRILFYEETLEPGDEPDRQLALARLIGCKGDPGW